MSNRGKTNYVTQQQLKTARGGAGVGHVHANMDTLSRITPSVFDAWSEAYADRIDSIYVGTARFQRDSDGMVHLPAYPDEVNWSNIQGKPSWIGNTKPSYSSSEVISFLGYTPADSASLGNYLPLTGGTVTGELIVKDNNYPSIAFKQGNDAPAYLTFLGYADWRVTEKGWNETYKLYHEGNANNAWTPWTCKELTLSNNGHSVKIELDANGNLKINGNVFATGQMACGA